MTASGHGCGRSRGSLGLAPARPGLLRGMADPCRPSRLRGRHAVPGAHPLRRRPDRGAGLGPHGLGRPGRQCGLRLLRYADAGGRGLGYGAAPAGDAGSRRGAHRGAPPRRRRAGPEGGRRRHGGAGAHRGPGAAAGGRRGAAHPRLGPCAAGRHRAAGRPVERLRRGPVAGLGPAPSARDRRAGSRERIGGRAHGNGNGRN